MHRAEEDYLKTIYKQTVEAENDLVKTTDIAAAMGFTDQTINEMVKRLAKKKMIVFIRYKGVYLTNEGLKEAKRLVRNHRLWEVFLMKKLNYSWEEVHDEAENLEHASSEKLMDHIDAFLNSPHYCVHGNAIPKKDGSVEPTCKKTLKTIDVHNIFRVRRVTDQPMLLKYLSDNKIHTGTQIKVLEKDDLNELMKVVVDQKEIILSYKIAEKIFGELDHLSD